MLVIDDGSTDATAAGRVGLRRDRRLVRGEPRPAGRHRGRLPRGRRAGVRVLRPGRCGRPASGGRAGTTARARPLGRLRRRRSDRGSRPAKATTTSATGPRRAGASGSTCCVKALHLRLGHRFHDPTSGMAAVNAKAMPVMAEPYVSGAPEVEALLRLQAEGLRVAGGRGRDAGARERRVEAAGEEGRQARAHGRRHADLLQLDAPPPPLVTGTGPRVVVVLGYSDGGRGDAASRLRGTARPSRRDRDGRRRGRPLGAGRACREPARRRS